MTVAKTVVDPSLVRHIMYGLGSGFWLILYTVSMGDDVVEYVVQGVDIFVFGMILPK